MAEWTRALPTKPGAFMHRNLENAQGRAAIGERAMWVGYVNWTEDRNLGHGRTPAAYMPRRLRACRIEHPMTADSLTVQEWGGEWRRIDGVSAAVAGLPSVRAATCQDECTAQALGDAACTKRCAVGDGVSASHTGAGEASVPTEGGK